MIFRSFNSGSYACVFISAVFLTSTLALSDSNTEEPSACSLDDIGHLSHQDISGFNMTEVNLPGYSSEGGKADVYWDNGSKKVIRSGFFGETGRREINYYFTNSDSDIYLVELIDFHYTMLAYQPGVQVASIVTSKFVVCNDREPNYPNSASLTDVYTVSVDVLAKILKTLKERQ